MGVAASDALRSRCRSDAFLSPDGSRWVCDFQNGHFINGKWAGVYVAGASEAQPKFLTEVASVRAAIRAGKPYYVYVLHRPNGRPFYVGKGVGLRARSRG